MCSVFLRMHLLVKLSLIIMPEDIKVKKFLKIGCCDYRFTLRGGEFRLTWH